VFVCCVWCSFPRRNPSVSFSFSSLLYTNKGEERNQRTKKEKEEKRKKKEKKTEERKREKITQAGDRTSQRPQSSRRYSKATHASAPPGSLALRLIKKRVELNLILSKVKVRKKRKEEKKEEKVNKLTVDLFHWTRESL